MVNFDGVIIGASTFFIIGLFHPLVIKGEYYFGRNVWEIFLMGGLVFFTSSLFVEGKNISIILGVLAFSSFWGIKEVFEQVERVKKGWYPSNSKRSIPEV